MAWSIEVFKIKGQDKWDLICQNLIKVINCCEKHRPHDSREEAWNCPEGRRIAQEMTGQTLPPIISKTSDDAFGQAAFTGYMMSLGQAGKNVCKWHELQDNVRQHWIKAALSARSVPSHHS